MHFVTSQSETEQITEVVTFLRDNFRVSLSDSKAITPAFNNFEDQIMKLDNSQDYQGILSYLLTLKQELL